MPLWHVYAQPHGVIGTSDTRMQCYQADRRQWIDNAERIAEGLVSELSDGPDRGESADCARKVRAPHRSHSSWRLSRQ